MDRNVTGHGGICMMHGTVALFLIRHHANKNNTKIICLVSYAALCSHAAGCSSHIDCSLIIKRGLCGHVSRSWGWRLSLNGINTVPQSMWEAALTWLPHEQVLTTACAFVLCTGSKYLKLFKFKINSVRFSGLQHFLWHRGPQWWRSLYHLDTIAY